MANIKSAQRRMRIETKAKLRNRMVKSELKTLAKKFYEAIDAGNKEAASALSREYTGALDTAALKGTIHRNTSNRKKAQIAKALGTLSA